MNIHAPIQTSTSEQYRVAARDWARADGHARELDVETDHWCAKRQKEIGADMSIAAAKRELEASQEYHDAMLEKERAKTAANQARGEMDYLAMRHAEEMRRPV